MTQPLYAQLQESVDPGKRWFHIATEARMGTGQPGQSGPDGLMVARSRFFVTDKLVGFHGAAQVGLLDANGVTIATSDLEIVGVDGQWIGTSDTTVVWKYQFSADLAAQARGLGIVHSWHPNWLQGIITIGTIFNDVANSSPNDGGGSTGGQDPSPDWNTDGNPWQGYLVAVTPKLVAASANPNAIENDKPTQVTVTATDHESGQLLAGDVILGGGPPVGKTNQPFTCTAHRVVHWTHPPIGRGDPVPIWSPNPVMTVAVQGYTPTTVPFTVNVPDLTA